MCSETSEAVGTTWEHAQLEFQKFLKIRIPLLNYSPLTSSSSGLRKEHEVANIRNLRSLSLPGSSHVGSFNKGSR